MELKTTELKKARLLIESDIRNGLFTPFLGAGASSLRSGKIDLDCYPWNDVAKTLTAVASLLETERSLEFLRSFAEQRLRLPDGLIRRLVPLKDRPRAWPKVDPSLSESPLTKLQVELIRATVRLTRYFGIRFGQESPSIHRLEDCSVEFRLKPQKIDESHLKSEEDAHLLARDALERLFAAADIALEFQKTTDDRHESPFLADVRGARRGLDRQRLYHKLLTLIVSLIGTNRATYEERLAKHRVGKELWVPDEVDEGKSDAYGRLRLDAVQWLSELIWYTVRYWVPCYPTTAELAFELSLAVKDAPPRRAELAQAAQALENANPESLPKIVANLVTYCEKVQEKRGGAGRETIAFYYAIAALLQFQFDIYLEEQKTRGTLKGRFGSERADGAGTTAPSVSSFQRFPVPIVFTTNFDSALEKMFTDNGLGYHIVFPVLKGEITEGEDETANAPTWMIRTCHPEGEDPEVEENDWHSIPKDSNGKPLMTFRGPIIVKLHGSPSLPRRGDSVFQHWLVLSEFGYLQALGSESRAPSWLERQLSSKRNVREVPGSKEEMRRSLWFLGYSISDWNVRLRLYEDCREHLKTRGGRRSTVDRYADVYRAAILGRLDVEQCVGDLNDLPGIVLRALEDHSIRKSPAVKNLVEKLKENLPR